MLRLSVHGSCGRRGELNRMFLHLPNNRTLPVLPPSSEIQSAEVPNCVRPNARNVRMLETTIIAFNISSYSRWRSSFLLIRFHILLFSSWFENYGRNRTLCRTKGTLTLYTMALANTVRCTVYIYLQSSSKLPGPEHTGNFFLPYYGRLSISTAPRVPK